MIEVPFSLIPFLLLAIPLCEIAVFVLVGSQIGVFPTLGLVVVTAIAGSIMLRIQGFGVLTRIRETMDQGGIPGRDLVHGLMIMVAGILLLTPGFVTDTLGLLLFIPALREAGWRLIKDRIVVVTPGGRASPRGPASGRGSTIDLDESEYSHDNQRGDSPWRKPLGGRRDGD